MRLITCLLLFISLNSSAQWKDYIISVKGDTLNRIDMNGKKQGPWYIKVDDLRGERGYEEEGYFENDQKEGVWKRYSLQGIKIAEENYRWGKLNGKCRYFTYNGGLLREESWWAMDPKIKFDTVDVTDVNDPSRVIDRVVVENKGVALKHGEWNFYDPMEGVIVKTEFYKLDKPANSAGEVMGDDLQGAADNTKTKSDTSKKTTVKYQPMLDYEKKNSGKKKIKERDGRTGY